MNECHVELRPAVSGDAASLRAAFAASRCAELRAAGLAARDLQQLLDLQYHAQEQQYRASYPQARCEVIAVDGQCAGRLIVDRQVRELRLVDILLLPEFHGRGIGERLLRQLQAEAARAGIAVTLQVAAGNPAQRLYERLGFVPAAGDAIYRKMRWAAADAPRETTENSTARGAAA